ncbi:MAG: hypothetical protein R3D85_16705 [Paracoccaceae bacterium]
MSPIEATGASALARGSPHNAQAGGFSARSGADKAQSIQGHATAAAAAPVETAQAVVQAQAAQSARLRSEQRPAADIATQAARAPARATAAPLTKPMTAVLLHELRLQQELASVQEEKEKKSL